MRLGVVKPGVVGWVTVGSRVVPGPVGIWAETPTASKNPKIDSIAAVAISFFILISSHEVDPRPHALVDAKKVPHRFKGSPPSKATKSFRLRVY
jgi:hypothetical protein